MRRVLLTLVFSSITASCIEVKDLRGEEAPADVPVGQIDTGWQPDAGGPDLPVPIACSTDPDCSGWLEGLPCYLARCTDGQCDGVAIDDGLPCSDGDPSTRGDQCQGGVCLGGPDVCICDGDSDCEAFDDGNPCNGRLICDGCGCGPLATPVGTECDDHDPGTLDDVCIDEQTCRGAVPCHCTGNEDCPSFSCTVSACLDCACISYPDAPGTTYLDVSIGIAVPPGFVATTSNPLIGWRATSEGVLRATGADGSYDHGPAESRLVSPIVALPDGAAILEMRIGLLSAEDGCDDRLEVRFGETLLHTLCGPTAVELVTVALPETGRAPLELLFISDGDSNGGAGAVLQGLRVVRVAPGTCGGAGVEVALPVAPGTLESRPDIAATAGEGGVTAWAAVWQDAAGAHLRAVDEAGGPFGPITLLDALGAEPVASRGHLAWTRGADVILAAVTNPAVTTVVPGATHPDLDGVLPALAVMASDGGAELRTASNVVLVREALPLFPGRAAELAGVPWLVVATAAGVEARREGESLALAGAQPIGRPDAAAGLNRVAAAWPTADSVIVATSATSLVVTAQAPEDVALTATASSWVVVWVEGGSGRLAGALLTGTLNQSLPLASVATYTFGGQAAPRLAPSGERALAVWQSPWLDGDASTVVARRLPHPLLDP